MKYLLLTRLPSACISFTIIMLATSLINLFHASFFVFPIQLFCIILGCQVIDWLLSYVHFKSYLQYCLAESAILYTGTLTAALLLDWISWKPTSIIFFTLIFLAADVFLFWYFKRRQKLLADEINQLLQ